MQETVSFNSKYITVEPEPGLDPAWLLDDEIWCLRRGMWTATVHCETNEEDGQLEWIAHVNDFIIINQPPITTSPGCITYICYFLSEEYTKRLAQRALMLYDERLRAKVEKDKDDKIAALERLIAAQDKQIEQQYWRIQKWADKLGVR